MNVMRYEIRLKGHLDDEWADFLGTLAVVREAKDITCLVCSVTDQAALFGILRKVRDLGIPLLSVNRIETGDEA